jgi:6-phosphogluconolactonase
MNITGRHIIYPRPGLNVYPDMDSLSFSGAVLTGHLASDAVARRGICTLALAGGSTPGTLYRIFATTSLRYAMPWEKIHVFWSDERCVPPDHPDSNYLLARTTFLDAVGLPEANIHRMRGEDDPVRAAEQHEREVRNFFDTAPGFQPRFDIVLLGMGEDGHTASLFPNADDLATAGRTVIASTKPGGWRRVSLTLEALNAARHVVFLVAGGAKAPMVARALGEPDPAVPAGLVRPPDGDIYWLVDTAAGAQASASA